MYALRTYINQTLVYIILYSIYILQFATPFLVKTCAAFLKIYYLKIYLKIANLMKLVYTFPKLQLLYAEDWD